MKIFIRLFSNKGLGCSDEANEFINGKGKVIYNGVDVDKFQKKDYCFPNDIRFDKDYKKFTLKIVQQKTPIKEISEDKINEIKKYLNDVDYNTIKFTLDDINYFIANEPHDIISVYELVLDFAEKDRDFNYFKDFFLEKPLEFSLKMDNNDFLEFMKAWKKLIVEFLSLADIPKSVYMNNDKNGSSVIEVLDKADNKKISDLSELKKLWNTVTK